MASAIDVLRKELADIQQQLDGYTELVQQRDRLSQALSVLEGTGPIAPTYPPSGATRAPRTRRSAGPLDEGAIIHAIYTHGEPAGAIDIREALGLPSTASNSLSVKLKALVDAGKLTRIGERRASRYSVPA